MQRQRVSSTCSIEHSVEPPKRELGGERRFRPCLPGLQGSKFCPEFRKREGALLAAVLPDRERRRRTPCRRRRRRTGSSRPRRCGSACRRCRRSRRPRPGSASSARGQRRARPRGGSSPTGSTRICTGREPERERAGVVLDEDADEPLEASRTAPGGRRTGCARRCRRRCSGSSRRVRLLAVELDRPHLPRAAERVGHVQVDLRAVERAVALVERRTRARAGRARRCSAPSVKSHSSSVPSLLSGRVESSNFASRPKRS